MRGSIPARENRWKAFWVPGPATVFEVDEPLGGRSGLQAALIATTEVAEREDEAEAKDEMEDEDKLEDVIDPHAFGSEDGEAEDMLLD